MSCRIGNVFAAAAVAGALAFTAQPAGAQSDPTERARLHYGQDCLTRALQLFNEQNYEAALFEMERCYELAPNYKLLYNMGRVQRQLNNHAAALRSFTRYLHDGGSSVPANRRDEVEAEMALARAHVATIGVTVNVDGADVYVDDIPFCMFILEGACTGKSPLPSVLFVNRGRHVITATKSGYMKASVLVSVEPGDAIGTRLDLANLAQLAAEKAKAEALQNPWRTPAVVTWILSAGVLAAGLTGVALGDASERGTPFFLIGGGVGVGVATYLTVRTMTWKF